MTTNIPQPYIIRQADGSIDVEPVGVNLDLLVNFIWRRAFVHTMDEDNEGFIEGEDREIADPDKELGSDFISEVVNLLAEAGLCPPLEERSNDLP